MKNTADEALICNAGVNTANITVDGTVTVCYDRQNEILGNIYTGFEFRKELVHCMFEHCGCPLWSFDKALHAKAKGEPHKPIGHDGFLHWYITLSCNFRCKYCIVDGTPQEDEIAKGKPAIPIDVDAAINTLDKTEKIFSISLMGGEPTAVPNFTELVTALTQKHFVSFNSNIMTLDLKLFEMCNRENLGTIHISFHIDELEKRNLMDRWIQKILDMKALGYHDFFITCVAAPETLPKVPYYKRLFHEKGLEFKLIPMLHDGSIYGKKYPESYTKEELAMMKANWLDDYSPVNKAEEANAGLAGEFSSSSRIAYEMED